MTQVMDLAKHVISQQHDTKLLNKKLDVIGILNQRNADATIELAEVVKKENEFLESIITEYDSVPLEDLVSKLDVLGKQRDEKSQEYSEMLDQVALLDKKLSEAQEKTLEVLNKDGEINGKQLVEITNRIEDLTVGVTTYFDAMKLTEVREGLKSLEETNRQTLEHQEATLVEFDNVLSDFKLGVETLNEKIVDYHNLNQNISDNLLKLDEYTQIVDQKLSQTSPHFQAPNTAEMVDVYTSLAQSNLDLEAAQYVLESQSLDEITEEFATDSEGNLTDKPEDDKVETSEETDELMESTTEHYNVDTNEHPQTVTINHTVEDGEDVGFFGRLFGKGK